MTERKFDPAAEFLLDLHWENLFEAIGWHGIAFNCKGCQAIVERSEREEHYRAHRREFGKPSEREAA